MLLIPVMYLRGGNALKAKADPIALAHDWFNAGAELIHIVDLDAPTIGASPNTEILKKIHADTKIAFEIEGNIKSVDTAERYFSSGATRITLGAVAYQKPAFLAELCEKFPKKIATHIDVRRGKVAIKGYSVATNKTPLDYAAQFKDAGVDTVYYSDSEEEGILKQADFGHIRDFLKKALIKVVHTTDITSNSDIEQLIMLEPYGLTGTLLGKSLYEGLMKLEALITHAKERSRGGLDEPTYTET